MLTDAYMNGWKTELLYHTMLVESSTIRESSGQRSKSCLSNNPKTTEANLTKHHRNIEHNEKVCRAQALGSYAQGQGHNQVKGQIVPKIVLLINY